MRCSSSYRVSSGSLGAKSATLGSSGGGCMNVPLSMDASNHGISSYLDHLRTGEPHGLLFWQSISVRRRRSPVTRYYREHPPRIIWCGPKGKMRLRRVCSAPFSSVRVAGKLDSIVVPCRIEPADDQAEHHRRKKRCHQSVRARISRSALVRMFPPNLGRWSERNGASYTEQTIFRRITAEPYANHHSG